MTWCCRCWCGIEVRVQQAPGFLHGSPLHKPLCIPPYSAHSLPTPWLWCTWILTGHIQPLHLSSTSLPGLFEGSFLCSAWAMHHSQQPGRSCLLFSEPLRIRSRRCKAQAEKDKEDKAPLQLHGAQSLSRARAGRPPFCSSSKGLKSLI